MRLLTPQASSDAKNQEVAREIIRTQEVERVAKDTRIRLAQAEADFSSTLAKQRERWAHDEEEHLLRVKEMEAEIDALEAKKLNALIPLGIIKDGVYDRMDDAVGFLATLRKREIDNDTLTERLEDKLDEVGEREQTVLLREQKAGLREEGVERQRQATVNGSARLIKDMEEFAVKMIKEQKDADEKRDNIILQEQSLKAKDILLQRNEKALNDLDRKLQDERETLNRAWEELKRKQ